MSFCVYLFNIIHLIVVAKVPFYKGENIKFDVVPNRLDLSVDHYSVSLQVLVH